MGLSTIENRVQANSTVKDGATLLAGDRWQVEWRKAILVFVGLVTACDPDHFRASDLPLLVRYTESIVLGDQAALELRKGAVVKGKSSPWLAVQREAIKAMVALSMRLRPCGDKRVHERSSIAHVMRFQRQTHGG